MDEIVLATGLFSAFSFLLSAWALTFAISRAKRLEMLEKKLIEFSQKTVVEKHWDNDVLYVGDALRRLMRELGYEVRYTESHYKLEKKERT